MCFLAAQVDEIVQRSGVHSLKSAEEREMERRIQERKQELMENYRLKREAQRRSMASVFSADTEVKTSVNPAVETLRSTQDDLEDRVKVSQTNGHHSTPEQHPQTENQPLWRTSSLQDRSGNDNSLLYFKTEEELQWHAFE